MRVSRQRLAVGLLVATGALFPELASAAAEGQESLGARLPAWSALPFVGILLSIALLPLLKPHFWHHHFGKVALGWALVLAVPYIAVYGRAATASIAHMAVVDYLPFIVLISSLFAIGGGILVKGSLRGAPGTNAAIMAIGTALASCIGTTGAAMLLIRPLLRANLERRHRAHTVVFFIFLVANIGGSLTPLGDPPLFLGFLHGVPFAWTLGLWRETLLVAGLVLGSYVALDLHYWRQESPEVRAARPGAEPLGVEGWHNFFFLGGALGAVVLSGVWHPGEVVILGVHQGLQNLVRDGLLLALAAASMLTTPRAVRIGNSYSWHPIREVAVLFAGIFTTMIPALQMLGAGEAGALAFVIRAVKSPAGFFWATGVLSSFLDNAPTYLTFLQTAVGRLFPGVGEREAIGHLIAGRGELLQAISVGAVFMGANTYIGNAPNFMVRSIAEEVGVRMPSFFGFIFRYSLPFLVPVFVLVTLVFFR
jgi:Na+/H+ antiporter NhaD/arsenite permease-like protein